MLDWDLIFIRNIDKKQDIMFHRRYLDGIPKNSEFEDNRVIFVNYISLFPNRDIIRIKLSLEEQTKYSYYYINKFFLKFGFLGIFGVSEYDVPDLYDWPETDLIAKFLFAAYFKKVKDGELNTVIGAKNYLNWLDNQVEEYYIDFLDSKGEFLQKKSKNNEEVLFELFQKEKNKKKKEKKKKKKKKENILYIVENNQEIKIDWSNIMKFFEIQLINSYGNPLTPIFSFLNGIKEVWGSEEEQTKQSLEGMTYSVLKTFVDQQNLNLEYMKCRKKKRKGFSYMTIFHNLIFFPKSFI